MRLKCCLLLATATHAFLARRLALLQRRTARSAVATTEEQQANATLLACAQAPDLFYLGDNETLYLRYLNSTRQLQNAKVEPKIKSKSNPRSNPSSNPKSNPRFALKFQSMLIGSLAHLFFRTWGVWGRSPPLRKLWSENGP